MTDEIIGKLPNPDDRIKTYHTQFANHTRNQLMREMNKWLPGSDQHIAAKQLLNEMDKADSDQKHKESLQQSRRANKLAIWAIFIAIVSLLLFTIDFVYRNFLASKYTNIKIEEIKLKPEQQHSAKDITIHPSDQIHKPQEQLKSKTNETK